MNGSQVSYLGAWMVAGTVQLKRMQEEEELNGVLLEEDHWVLSY